MRENFKVTQRDVNGLPEGIHRIEPNFYIRVRGKYRNYLFKGTIEGKRREIGLGSTDEITLAMAKARVLKLRSQIASGEKLFVDAISKEETEEKHVVPTFREVADQAIDTIQNQKRWTNSTHAHQWRQTVKDYAIPVIGDKKIDDITVDDILEIIVPIWDTKTETASRLLKRLEKIFQYAIFKKLYTHPNPAVWTGNLEMILPSSSRIITRKHFEAPTVMELRAIVPKLLTFSSVSKCTLFAILTASRVQEAALAKWDEIDFETRTFTVPPERRKDKKDYPHRVPLSSQAIFLLKSIERKGDYVFPSPKTWSKAIDKNSPRVCLITFIKRPVTMHGCRSTFRDWCAENGVDPVLAEKSLMHTTGNEVEQAYQRADLLEQRRPIMQKWADVLFEQ